MLYQLSRGMQRFMEVFKHDGEAAKVAGRGETEALLVCLFSFAQEAVREKYEVGDVRHRARWFMRVANYHRLSSPHTFLTQQAIDIPRALAALEDWMKTPSPSL